MNTDELNQLGILMNVVAGILMAPDLIGKVRLRKFENWLEEELTKLVDKMNVILAKYFPTQVLPESQRFLKGDAQTVELIAIWSIISLFVWWIVGFIGDLFFHIPFFWCLLLTPAFVLFSLCLVLMVTWSVAEIFGKTFAEQAFSLLVFVVGIFAGAFVGAFFLIAYILPKGLERIIYVLVSRMKRGRQSVLSTMLTIGVILFISGNLLQFLAARAQQNARETKVEIKCDALNKIER